ncbi:MAG: hypothetical protein IRZ31_11335 [Thermogemmatispora sp.]|uniref:hypothetical protein n=1 Tax=Thermogemmatispora sp. TaxID=1968838 RepID=UPI002631A109|nr:hypothetical protein [Thermogemmatispora sp.]MBX5457484.1 hypothetical protein [Thermogemmatispora sp.]
MLRWLICLTGLLIVGLGLVVGWRSHQVTYRSSGRGVIAHYLSDPQTHEGYLQLEGSPTLYLLREQDFLPPIKGTATLKDLMLVALLYRPDESAAIDVRAQLGTHLVGPAYPVVALTLYDLNGAVMQEFKSTLYRQNPQGFYENDWPLGGGLSLLGAVLSLGGGASLWKRRRGRSKEQATSVHRPTPEGPPLAPLAPSLRLPSRSWPSGGGHSGLRPPSGPPLSGPRP